MLQQHTAPAMLTRSRCPPIASGAPRALCSSRNVATTHGPSHAYQKPLSTHSFRSSRGGMNPNLDFWGMFRSSMKATCAYVEVINAACSGHQ
eukprot:1157259-Pelagomonas_calceolata.AAC.17